MASAQVPTNQPRTARDWLDTLQLLEHPEGGYYRVTYTADTTISQAALPGRFRGPRPVSTAIYFLLSNQKDAGGGDGFSAFHRLQSDEMWHFHTGGPLNVHVLAPDGSYTLLVLGPDARQGQQFQSVVRAGCWFASAPAHPDTFALVGCTVSPGFDFEDFELARYEDLAAVYPEHRDLIRRFTRQ